MATFSFKNVGKTQETLDSRSGITTQVSSSIGIATPLRSGNGFFAMHFDLADQIDDNLKNLIMTNWGERIGRYNYGANLLELVTEVSALSNFESEVIARIKNAVSRWLPYIELQTFEMKNSMTESTYERATFTFTITYDIPRLGIQNRALEITLRTMA